MLAILPQLMMTYGDLVFDITTQNNIWTDQPSWPVSTINCQNKPYYLFPIVMKN